MRKGKDLIGMSVVGQSDGAKLGRVRDLIFDSDANELLALVLSEKDLFGLIDAQIVPWHEVRSLGGDVILATDAASVRKLRDDDKARELATRENVLSGTQILTSEGKELGTLADMVIDEQTGSVLGYEVSGGLVADTLKGKQFLPQTAGLTIGDNVAIVPPVSVEELRPLPRVE